MSRKTSAWTGPCRSSSSSSVGHAHAELRRLLLPPGSGRQARDLRPDLAHDAPGADLHDRLRDPLASSSASIADGAGQQVRRWAQGFTLFVYSMPEFGFGILVLMAFAGGVGPFPSLFSAGGYSTPGRT